MESAETQDYVSAPLADELHGAENGDGGRERHGGVELCPECSQRATLGPAQVVITSLEQKAASSSKLLLLCQKKEAQRTINLGKTKGERSRNGGFKVEGPDRAS